MYLSAREIAAAAGGEVVAGDADALATAFGHDSRIIEPGACFVALEGHRDGHDFVADAFTAGATVALVSHLPGGARVAPGRAVVAVGDPLAGLGRIAAHCRAGALAHVVVVGITGSTGKTSTKDLAAGALGRARSVHANPDSFNNEVGLPLTLLGAGPHTDVVIAEMGARFAGNITDLCAMALPEVGVVTNVGLAHAEHLGGREGVFAVKAELLEALPPDGLAVLNADDEPSSGLGRRTAARVLTAGTAAGADVRVREVHLDAQLRPSMTIDSPWGTVDARLQMRGEHQVENAALAVAVALALGVAPDDVSLGIADATGSRWRMQIEHSPGGVVVLNDAYNANPASMEAALRSLARIATRGRRFAILGEMRELGTHSDDAHARVGRLAAELHIDGLVAVGDLEALASEASAGVPAVQVVPDAPAALVAAAALAAPGDAVLVKASRAVGLEHVAAGLVAGFADGGADTHAPLGGTRP